MYQPTPTPQSALPLTTVHFPCRVPVHRGLSPATQPARSLRALRPLRAVPTAPADLRAAAVQRGDPLLPLDDGGGAPCSGGQRVIADGAADGPGDARPGRGLRARGHSAGAAPLAVPRHDLQDVLQTPRGVDD